ncbi:MAG: hypothetical protein E3J88_04985 [Anaerolineales bacterium]|jgi:hypothetical protein|nr:MAG: hypothetical protein E3J88_04985 [Anaerolineales bacterium]
MEMSDDFITQGEDGPEPKDDRRRLIFIIAAVAIVILCCCILTAYLFYDYLGDPIMEFLGF